MKLGIEHFERFFHACHGQSPFPWQSRLCAQALAGGWPRVIGLPTASGKTAVIDIAVFVLAAGAPGACRRTAFVVDRRVVVDEAAERARLLAELLENSTHSDVSAVADGLRRLSGDGPPLLVSVLRGGIPPDAEWARTPTQPVVLLSTVDQVGSRLLFRAYGRHGPRAWPIHAGLVGRDTLIVVDEAHCSRPFCQTARAVIERYGSWSEVQVGRPSRVVMMSATAGEVPDFGLEGPGSRGEALEPRLTVAKRARLLPVQGKGGDRSAIVDRMLAEAERFAAQSGVVGVVVNRVADARAIFERLSLPADQKLLLTGRVRAWERDQLIESWRLRLRATPGRIRADRPYVVVATQCIEVGANLDFDALVTECAPLDSLRQRFGRLDRLGIGRHAEAVVVGAEKPEADDPVYGPALAKTWAYLWGHADVAKRKEGKKAVEERSVDFGVDALDRILADAPPEDGLPALCAPAVDPPMLLPAHLDLLGQTSPPPVPGPDVAQLLHGLGTRTTDVTLVWRADLVAGQDKVWVDRVAVQPPSVGEGCPVPLWAARKWLTQAEITEPIADVEGLLGSATQDPGPIQRRALRWRGPDGAALVWAGAILPGDMLVVPATWGGCDEYGWNPGSPDPVTDIGDAVAAGARSRPVLRIHPEVVRKWCVEGPDADVAAIVAVLSDPTCSEPEMRASLAALSAHPGLEPWVRDVASSLMVSGCTLMDAGDAPALVGRPTRPGPDPDASTADDTSSLTVMATLEDHSHGVEAWSRRIAGSCLVEQQGLLETVALAAWLHDVGKADPRFQVWLHGGDEVAAAMAPALLAKSGANARNRVAIERARRRARYPKGTRHEMASTAMVDASDALRTLAAARGCDWDLLLHLIASHHGFARPFAPVPEDDLEPLIVAVVHGGIPLATRSDHALHRADSGIADRFWSLIRRYGWHGLAFLEAMLRLADHRRSEEEEHAALEGAS